MRSGNKAPVCRRVTARVGRTVLTKGLGGSSTLPSVETLSTSVGIDIVAAGGTCRRLRGRGVVCSIPKGNFFISGPSVTCLRRGHALDIRRRLTTIVRGTGTTRLSRTRFVSVIEVL